MAKNVTIKQIHYVLNTDNYMMKENKDIKMNIAADQTSQIFRNLIPCSSYIFPFVDRYAQFGVSFDQGRALGLGMIQPRSTFSTFQIACSGLALWVDEDGQLIPLQRSEIESLPWCVIEKGNMFNNDTEVEVVAKHVFLDEVTLHSEFTFINDGENAVTITPVWKGQFSGDRWRKGLEHMIYGYRQSPSLRETWAESGKTFIRGGLKSVDKDAVYPAPAIQVTCEDNNKLSLGLSEHAPWSEKNKSRQIIQGLFGKSIFYTFKGKQLEIAPGLELKFSFNCEFSVSTYLDSKYHFRKLQPEKINIEKAIAKSKKDFEDRVSVNHPPLRNGQPALQAKLWRARWALLRTGYRGRGKAGEYGKGLAATCVTGCHAFTRVFFWDALFSAAAFSKFEPEMARGAIKCVFSRQLENGFCPEHSYNYHIANRNVVGGPQAPVASWAVEHYLSDHPQDNGFLEEIYPMLARNHRYWVEKGDSDGDGLAEWTWSGQTADNSPLYDEYHPQKGGCGWLPPIASVQLNAFLYRDAMTIAKFADILGKKKEAKAYRRGAKLRAEALNRICYAPKEKRYWDFNHATGRHCRIKTFYMFWPIWAGMPVPVAAKKDLIENVLLDPGQFFGDIPFPSVSYDDPEYDPTGYWRGKTWPHISYWLIEMLMTEGYIKEAEKAAKRLVSAWGCEASFTENLASDPGWFDDGGVADYNWGIAAFYLLGTREYAQTKK